MANRREIQRRASGAHDLLQHPDYIKCREAVNQTIVNQLLSLELCDKETEHELCVLLRASDMFHQMLERYLSHGNMAEALEEARNSVV